MAPCQKVISTGRLSQASRERGGEVVKKSRRFRPAACPATDRDLIPIRGGGEVWFFSGARVNRGPSMIHARRRESGISRSRDRRSDRLYRVSSGGLLVHFLAPFPFSLSLPLSSSSDTPPLFSRLAGDGEPRTIGVT